jgi:hypothetical protein
MGQHDTQNTSVKNEGGKERVLGWCVDGRGDAGVQCGNAELAGGVEVERRVLHVGKDATEASGLCQPLRVEATSMRNKWSRMEFGRTGPQQCLRKGACRLLRWRRV